MPAQSPAPGHSVMAAIPTVSVDDLSLACLCLFSSICGTGKEFQNFISNHALNPKVSDVLFILSLITLGSEISKRFV